MISLFVKDSGLFADEAKNPGLEHKHHQQPQPKLQTGSCRGGEVQGRGNPGILPEPAHRRTIRKEALEAPDRGQKAVRKDGSIGGPTENDRTTVKATVLEARHDVTYQHESRLR